MKITAFTSSYYHPFIIAEFLEKSYQKNTEPVRVVLTNFDKLIVPTAYKDACQFWVISPKGKAMIAWSDLIDLPHAFINAQNVTLAQINSEMDFETNEDYHQQYIQQCQLFILSLLDETQKVLQYTVDHLRQRQFATENLLSNDLIQDTIAQIVSEVKASKLLLTDADSILSLRVGAEYLHNALHQLTKITGGRALLKGNVVEILFYSQLFFNLFLDENAAN